MAGISGAVSLAGEWRAMRAELAGATTATNGDELDALEKRLLGIAADEQYNDPYQSENAQQAADAIKQLRAQRDKAVKGLKQITPATYCEDCQETARTVAITLREIGGASDA